MQVTKILGVNIVPCSCHRISIARCSLCSLFIGETGFHNRGTVGPLEAEFYVQQFIAIEFAEEWSRVQLDHLTPEVLNRRKRKYGPPPSPQFRQR